MSIKLNVWHIQEVLIMPDSQAARLVSNQTIGFQPLRFTRRNGQPEVMGPYPTLEAARKACGSPDAKLL